MLDLIQQELGNVSEILDVVEAGINGDTQYFGVSAAVVHHVENADRAGLNQDSRDEVEVLQQNQGVQRISIFAQRVLEVAVMRGVLHRGEEHAIQPEAVGLVVDLILDA